MRQKESKAKGREGKECLVVLVTDFNRVCKQIVSEGTDLARDGARSRLLLKIVDEIHTVAKCHEEHREHCQEGTRRVKDGSSEELDLHLRRMREGAEQGRLGKRQARHAAVVAKLLQSAGGGARMLTKLLNQLTGEEEQHSSGCQRKRRLRARE